MNEPSEPLFTSRPIVRVTTSAVGQTTRGAEPVQDDVAIERALEIRIAGRTLSVTLRTPGHDRALVLGFLAGEALIARGEDVAAIDLIAAACADEPDRADVTLAPGVRLDWSKLERHFTATSACGLCGRAHLDALRSGLAPLAAGPSVRPDDLLALAGGLRPLQVTFASTGGLHAAAYADEALAVQVLHEDVGRHNAVDKVCGWLLEAGCYPAGKGVLWVSGRAGAEIVLKAARAGIPTLAAVGAPSSLAVELAESAGMTLIGFLREGRMNVYCGESRLQI